MKKKLYKVLVNGKSCHGGSLEWSLPTKVGKRWKPGKWHDVSGPLELCQTGLHLTADTAQWLKIGCEVFEAEGAGESAGNDEKIAFLRARLIRKVASPKWWTETEKYISTIPSVKWFSNHDKPLPEWKVFDTGDAARAEARAEARAAARAAAGDAARAAAGDAARDAARAAAGAAARHAARAAAGDAARAAAWDAARDAALLAQVKICDGAKLDQKHIDHAYARWDVWVRGYGLACDVGGVLYVYKRI